jgi:ABC-type sugar transport system substrate-binding protein
MTKVHRTIVQISEYILYALLLAQPATGLGMALFSGRSFALFLWRVPLGGAKSLGQISPSQRAFGVVYTKLTIPVIVRGRLSAFWQTVLSRARKAGQDLGVDIVELGTDSESDAEGQSTYRHRVESFGDRHRTCAF